MTGTQLPIPPTDRAHGTDQPSLATDRTPTQTPPSATPSVLLTIAVLLLGGAAIALGALLLLAVSERAELRAENERLEADNERLMTANEDLSSDLRGWEGEVFEEGFDLGDPVALFASGTAEELSIDGAARYVFDGEAGQLLELVAPGDGDGYFFLELVEASGRFVGYADIGSFPDEGFYGYGPRDHAWFVLDQDGSYELTVHEEGRLGPDEATGTLTVQLHTLADGLASVVDVSEPYPTAGELPIHTFEGRSGQLAIVTMTSGRPEAIDPFVRLYGPDGTLVGQDDDGAGGLDARLVMRLPDDGTYEVEADTFDGGLSRRSSREVPYTLTVELADLG